MKSILNTLQKSLKKDGAAKTLIKIARYPLTKARDRKKVKLWQEILKNDMPAEDRFTIIYQNKMWGEGESASGFGSSLAYTENVRAELPKLIKKYNIKTIFDAPCGDLNWMRHLLPTLGVKYIGGDIVKELIEKNKERFANEHTNFLHIDLIKEAYPKADLMICRDCIFHLSYQDTKCLLENFLKAEISYLLTTTHITTLPNTDIKTGDYRPISLFDPPYQFDNAPLERIDDWMHPESKKQLCLWSRSQIMSAVGKFNNLHAGRGDI